MLAQNSREAPPEAVSWSTAQRTAAQRFLVARAAERFATAREETPEGRQQLESALDALQLALTFAPEPWVDFNLAQVQSRLGHCQQARALYQRFLEIERSERARADAEQRLAALSACQEDTADAESPAGVTELGGFEPELREPGSDRLASEWPALAPEFQLMEPEPGSALRLERALPMSLAALSVLAGGAAAIYWGQALDAKHDLTRLRVAGPRVPETQERGRSAQTSAVVWSSVAGALAIAAVGSYWWLRAPEPSDAPSGWALFSLERGAGAVYGSVF